MINTLIYFLIMIAEAFRAEGWTNVYFLLISPFLIFGNSEVIQGLVTVFLKKISKTFPVYFGLLHFIFGFFYIFYFYYYALAILIPGIIITVLGIRN